MLSRLAATARSGTTLRAVRLIATRLLVLAFVLWAGYYLLTALSAIVNFAWRQPMFDQWRMYAIFLDLPFPQNVLQLENGHRPIIPNLIRVAEIRWFGANQLLQTSIGTLCALLTAGIVAASLVSHRELPLLTRAAGIMLAVIGVFWLANARMLLHGHEALHAYLVTLMVACAGLCTWKASLGRPLHWLAIASGACVVATFSFGPGVASFPAIMLLGVLLRLRWRYLLVPSVVLALCLVLYLLVLPGGQTVRRGLDFRPFASLVTTAQWLASPWVNAWLGWADPPLQSDLQASLRASTSGRFLIASAHVVTLHSDMVRQWLAAGLGLLGIATFLARVALFHRRHAALSQTQALAIALCLFALATAAMMGIARLDYFVIYPGQIYADRYLLWPCLFWLGLSLLLLIDVSRMQHRSVTVCGILFLLLLPMAMLPTHQAWGRWGMVVYERSQESAAAARSDVFDAEVFPDGADASRSTVTHTLALLKKDHLAMFAGSGWKLLGTQVAGSLVQDSNLVADASLQGVFVDPLSELPVARIEGVVLEGMARIQPGDELAIVDVNNRIVGFAEFSFIAQEVPALRTPRKRGFDGYVDDYHAGQSYRVVLLLQGRQDAVTLAEIASP